MRIFLDSEQHKVNMAKLLKTDPCLNSWDSNGRCLLKKLKNDIIPTKKKHEASNTKDKRV